MIEINLLPMEYRPREKTNVPLMLTVAVGMLLVGSIILWGIKLNNELAVLNSTHKDLTDKKANLDAEVKVVKDLENKIKSQQARQKTIIEISLSKVMWSLKLQQLAQIMGQFPNFWIKRLSLTKSAKGNSLSLDVSATGSSLREVARFRDALKNDPNFFYHFETLQSPNVAIVELQPGFNFTEQMDFSVKLPLKSSTAASSKKKKKKKKKR